MLDHKPFCDLCFIERHDAQGRRYIRAYKTVWVKKTDGKPGHPKLGVQHHVGALKDNGLVKISKQFLERYPGLKGRDWYYYDHALYDWESYQSLTGNAKAEKPLAPGDEDDETQEPNSKIFGSTFALFSLLQSSGILDSLTTVLGKNDAYALAAQAIYHLLARGSADAFPVWSYNYYLSSEALLSGQRISELFTRVSREKMDQFWFERYKRAQSLKRSDNPQMLKRFCIIDSTSISTYSESIEQAEFGHAKRDADIPQINLSVVMDQQTGEIVYACVSSGSINDFSSFSDVVARMQQVGFDMNDFAFVADRGYGSNGNINMLIREGVPFVLGVKMGDKSINDKLLRSKYSLLKRYVTYDGELKVHAVTVDEKVKVGEHEKTVYTHLYYDPRRGTEECTSLRGFLQEVLKQKDAKQKVAPDDWRRAAPWLKVVKVKDDSQGGEHKRSLDTYQIDESKWEGFERRSGCFVIRTDVYANPLDALRLYRMRNLIEDGFKALRNGADGDRLRTTSRSYWGKLLSFLISECLVMMILRAADLDKQSTGEKSKPIPGNSVPKLLLHLSKIRMSRHRQSDRWKVDQPTKMQRMWLQKLFGIEKLPGFI